MCLEAIKEAGKTGQIQIIAFDEEAPTLQGIIDGHIYGTVVQNPYRYGYESVRILAALRPRRPLGFARGWGARRAGAVHPSRQCRSLLGRTETLTGTN